MKVQTSFNTGLRIGDRYFGPCQWHDDPITYLEGREVQVFWHIKDTEPSETYTVPPGTLVYGTDQEGEYLLGTVE